MEIFYDPRRQGKQPMNLYSMTTSSRETTYESLFAITYENKRPFSPKKISKSYDSFLPSSF